MPPRTIGALGLACSLAAATAAAAQSPTGVTFTQFTRPVAEVADSATIRFLLFELFIEPALPASRLAVIDVTLNGFGPDDIVVTYPSGEAFLIPGTVPDSVQRIMSSWAPDVEYRLDAGNLPADALAALIGGRADTTRRAEKAILYDVVQAIERNYRDLPLGLLYERDSVGFTFQMWDYNAAGMQYVPRPAFDSDSTVHAVLEALEGVGYLPGQSAAGGGAALNRESGGVTGVADVLLGLRNVPSEQTRQMAARTVLVGSFDFDRSGSIDTPREVDAVSCDVWVALDATFPRFLYRFGFTDSAAPYFGSLLFGVSETTREATAARGVACLEGRSPPATVTATPVRARPPIRLPTAVAARIPIEAAAEVVREVGSAEAGSATWAAAVKTVLVRRFDANASGLLDTAGEVDDVPCDVWEAVASTHERFLDDLGFSGKGRYLGERIGIASAQRDYVTGRIRACRRRTQPVATRRVGTNAPVSATPNRARMSTTLAANLAGLSAIPDEGNRELTARTVLLSWLDSDRSGYIDTADELDAMSCPVWSALDRAFPGFAEAYGFVPGTGAETTRYLGSIIFNISVRLREPAERRVDACRNGQTPPATRPEDIAPPPSAIQIPAALEQVLQAETAVAIVRATERLEPGSAAWASVVQATLQHEYDFDRSGMLDVPAEIDAVPCLVWETVQATLRAPLSALGFGETGQYVGDRIGVAETERVHASQRIRTCTP